MSHRIVITGASGFIGSFLVDEALRLGYDVTAAIRSGSPRTFLADPRIRFVSLAYETPERLVAQLRDLAPDYVIHCAGTTGTKGYAEFEKVNYEYTRNLVDTLNRTGLPIKKFLYMSTLAVYGPGDPVTFAPLSQGMTEQPMTMYAMTKLKAERYIASASTYPFVIVRPTAVYGPRDKDFLAYFKWIKSGFEPHIGTHRQMLSMIYVKDLAEASLALLELPGGAPMYIASDGQAYEEADLGRHIRTVMQKKPFSLRIPLPLLRPLLAVSDTVHGWLGSHPFLSSEKLEEVSAANWLCDSTPLWTALRRSPRYLLHDGIAETAAWYREQGWL